MSLAGAAAAESGCRRFVYVSNGAVYASQTRKPAAEDAKIKPFTTPARFNHLAEGALQKLDLDLVIARPALVRSVLRHVALRVRGLCREVRVVWTWG